MRINRIGSSTGSLCERSVQTESLHGYFRMKRTRVYVDGFNFYYAVRDLHDLDAKEFPLGLGWCDFGKLATQYMLGAGNVLDGIKYFTAQVTGEHANHAGEDRRQQIWLDAVSGIDRLELIKGFHQKFPPKAREEKQTDIKIAVELLIDATNNDCDHAILITGDIDQAPAVHAARERLPRKMRIEVDVWIPPGIKHGRWSAFAKKWRIDCREITPNMLATSRLDDVVTAASGRIVKCLEEWKMPTGLEGLRWQQVAPKAYG